MSTVQKTGAPIGGSFAFRTQYGGRVEFDWQLDCASDEVVVRCTTKLNSLTKGRFIMVGKVLKELLTEAYDAWYNDLLTADTYKGLSELILAKATVLWEQKIISAAEWDAIQDENEANLILVDDVTDV